VWLPCGLVCTCSLNVGLIGGSVICGIRGKCSSCCFCLEGAPPTLIFQHIVVCEYNLQSRQTLKEYCEVQDWSVYVMLQTCSVMSKWSLTLPVAYALPCNKVSTTVSQSYAMVTIMSFAEVIIEYNYLNQNFWTAESKIPFICKVPPRANTPFACCPAAKRVNNVITWIVQQK